MDYDMFNRVERLIGAATLEFIAGRRVIVFGVGGVGSWCAESLVRSGVADITLADPDRVCPTNINRQSMATVRTVGQIKVEALRDKLLEINPKAKITIFHKPYSATTAREFDLSSFDYVIDAIDSLADKTQLILNATRAQCRFFSSMGAALKIDPLRIKADYFYKIEGCPLARALRKRFKSLGVKPEHKFLCVYGNEVLPNLGAPAAPTDPTTSYADPRKAQINGSLAHITAIFGFTLAGLVFQDMVEQSRQLSQK